MKWLDLDRWPSSAAASRVLSDIVIAPATRIDRGQLAALARKGAFSILYLGTSYSHYASLRDHLPAGWSMTVPGPLLNAAAARMRDFFINLDSFVWPKGKDRAAWDATRLGERGPLASPLMLNLSRLAVFADTVAKPGPHLVIGDGVTECRLWMDDAKRRGHAVTWLGPDLNALHGIKRVLRSVRQRVAVVKRFAARKLLLAQVRRRHPLPVESLRAASAILTIWGRENTFPKTGMLDHESNFGPLPRLLREAGHRVAYLVYPLYTTRFRDVVANATQANEPVVFIEDLIPWRAVFASVFEGLTFPQQILMASISGLDTTPILQLEAERDRELASCSEATLLRSIGAGLAALGIQPDLLMHLYEAQPWEKMLAHGVREHLPSTRIVGVQHAPFARTYTSFFPSRRSIADGATADIFLATGAGYGRWLREAGVPEQKIGVVGAIRYESAAGAAPVHGNAVLCCTGIDLDEAIELASKAAVATQGLGRRLIINYHPVTDEAFRSSLRASVMQAAGAGRDQITFSSASIRELLAEVSVVLYTTSAACFEAVKAGRAAIYVARDLQLDYDKLPDLIALRCRSVEELRELLRKPDLSEHSAQSPEALGQWLGPVVDGKALAAMLARPSPEHEDRAAMRGAR
jgi:hypothetical protein